jgi:phenylacetate-CoA ligase
VTSSLREAPLSAAIAQTRIVAESAIAGVPHSWSFVKASLALERAQQLKRTQLEQLRLAALQKLLDHASTWCPYYADTLRPTLDRLGPLRSLEQLAEFPIITRDDVRRNSTAMLDYRRRVSDLQRGSTGGTTGTPMPFYTDAAYRFHSRALVARVYRTIGRNLFSPTVLMAGSAIDSQRWRDMRQRMFHSIRRTAVIPAFDVSRSSLPAMIALIEKKRPAFLMCYVSTLQMIARYCKANDARLQLPAVVPLAELVTEAHRQQFAEVFGAKTFEIYGAREATGMAVECAAHSGLHVQEDAYVLEFARAGIPTASGSPGEVLVTDLGNRAMPLIRYKIGDVGRHLPDRCTCGRSFGLMEVTHGRVLDVIISSNGTLLPGEYFPHLFKEVDRDVQAFQVWQRKLDALEISMVVRDGVDETLEEYLRSRILAKLGNDVQLTFRRVQKLTVEASGKWRATRSDVGLPW